jgi:hypothetical protein
VHGELEMNAPNTASSAIYGSLGVLPTYAIDKSRPRVRNQGDRHAISRWLHYSDDRIMKSLVGMTLQHHAEKFDKADPHVVDLLI